MLAALGGILSERGGIVNIALEGIMLTGAFVGMWVGQDHGLAAGVAGAALSGALIGLMHYLVHAEACGWTTSSAAWRSTCWR